MGINAIEDKAGWGAWVAQSVKRLTLGFSSSHGLAVLGSSPLSRAPCSVGSLLEDSLPHPLPLPPLTLTLSLSLSL